MQQAAHERALGAMVARILGPPEAGEKTSPGPAPPAELVERHGLTSLAYKAGCQQFRDAYLRNALLAEIRYRIADEAIAALHQRGIRVAPLKGLAYAEALYDDPGDRPMGDIDLLVPPRQHADAVRVLQRLGYRRRPAPLEASSLHHACTLRRPDGATVDLHRALIQPLRSRIDMDAVWHRAGRTVGRLLDAARLDPVDEACLHLIHVARHELLVPVVAYVDAARLVARPGVTWPRVLERATSFRLGHAVAAAWAVTEALRAGTSPRWPSRRARVLPRLGEILQFERPSRPRQILRKAALVEGPAELAGLLAVASVERWTALAAWRGHGGW